MFCNTSGITMTKIKQVVLEDNDNIHSYKFKITFKPNDNYDHDDEDYDVDDEDKFFPDESDIESAIDTSMQLDQDNEYIVSQHKITDKKAVFIIEVTNEETNEYMPTEEDIETTIENTFWWNEFYVELISETISRSELRDEKLKKIGI